MVKKEPFFLVYAPVVHEHLGAIDAKYDSLIREKIKERLTHEPDVETRNRKPVRPPAAFKPNGNYGSARTIGSAFSTKSTTRAAKYGSSPSE